MLQTLLLTVGLLCASTVGAEPCHVAADDPRLYVDGHAMGDMTTAGTESLSSVAFDPAGAISKRSWFAPNEERQLFIVMDIRATFPSSERARRFVAEQAPLLSEGAQEMESTEIDGVKVRVFGPTSPKAVQFARVMALPNNKGNGYIYLFVVGPVAAKVFLYQGAKSPVDLHRLDHVDIVRAAVDQLKLLTATLACAAEVPVDSVATADHAASAVDGYFAAQGDVVLDRRTGLIWQRCSIGQSWSAEAGCIGTVRQMHWVEALQQSNGPWRLPSREELRTIVDRDRMAKKLAPTIDQAVFPGMDPRALDYWSCTGRTDYNPRAWSVSFSSDHATGLGYGNVFNFAVRLVRGEQLTDEQADVLAGLPSRASMPGLVGGPEKRGPGC